jgi:hypothetical protein
MKVLWCWRCQQEMPMLEEEEYAETLRLYNECATGTKEFRERWWVPLESVGVRERFLPVRKWYEELTGVADCDEGEILRHCLARFGAACRVCGKPLRTPRARLCAECGARVT